MHEKFEASKSRQRWRLPSDNGVASAAKRWCQCRQRGVGSRGWSESGAGNNCSGARGERQRNSHPVKSTGLSRCRLPFPAFSFSLLASLSLS